MSNLNEAGGAGSQKAASENAPVSVISNFIKDIINDDLKSGKHAGIITRFPPEPNGYLHIGHAKSICLNFGLAKEYGGRCHLRFDDTNPCKEDIEYIESIERDVKWLGFDWNEHLYYASDYYDALYEYAVALIKMDKAYVCELTNEEMREYRGTLTEGGKHSPHRDRPVSESLELFERMKKGEFEDGKLVLRAKIDMSSPNINMRDPIIYRIRHTTHHRTGDKWCIYPMYDFTHCVSDAIEKITHSICTLEFEDHRPLYDWFLDVLKTECHPRQIEFARLNLTFTVMSKRKLLELVEKKYVSGWDDPRMPTISGLRRRGYTAEAIRNFCEMIGVAKSNSTVDFAMLEYCVREDLNKKAMRVMGVLKPLKVVITNYPDGQVEELDAQNNPEDESAGTRKIPFSKVIYIERDDFREDPPKQFFRLAPGREVRLKHAYYIKCETAVKDEKGEITELHCTYDPATKGGWSDDGRKVQGTLHWVSAAHALECEVRIYDQLFTKSNPDETASGDYKENLNENSLVKLYPCYVEPGLKSAKIEDRYQFLRQGYFCLDSDSTPDKLIFNRTVSLVDTWAKLEKKIQKK
ncbi:MAG: Glutamine--tRNA ligase [bacterium ADurb.Bin243]|nr:MAG: Glutamine--tRNA ligase [bacterium ADurb.Bin243]